MSEDKHDWERFFDEHASSYMENVFTKTPWPKLIFYWNCCQLNPAAIFWISVVAPGDIASNWPGAATR